jgi:multiple sugar transport system substrate-binding protein
MRKLLPLVLVVLLIPSFLVFAAGGQEVQDQKSDVTIRVLAGSIPWTDFIKAKLPEFTAKTGIKVELEAYPEDVLRNKAVVELTARSKDFDVYTTSPPQEMLMFANNNWIEPLDSYIADSPEFEIGDFMPGAISGSKLNGKTYSIPLFTERPVLYYRADVFKEKGLEPPKTFDELMGLAAKLHDPDNKFYGFVERGAGNAAVTQFVTFLRGFGGDYQSADYRTATINTPEALKAFRYYGEILRKYGPPGVLSMNWGETSNIFTEGLVAMRIDNDSQYGRAVDPEKSAVWDKVAFAVVPEGPAGLSVCNVAPWAVMVPSFSTKKDAAWEFIKWSTSKEMSLLAMQAGQFGARQSTWNNPAATETLPPSLVQAVIDSMGAKYSIERPVTIQVGKTRDIIGTVIQAGIQGVSDAELKQIAEKANADFQKVLDEDY